MGMGYGGSLDGLFPATLLSPDGAAGVNEPTGYADLNASANILASGIGAAGRGGAFSLETPMIRQIGGICKYAI